MNMLRKNIIKKLWIGLIQVDSNYKGVLYHRKDGKIFFTKKFLMKAWAYIEFYIIYGNKYQVCDCHFEYVLQSDEYVDDDDYVEEYSLTNLCIDRQPTIMVKSNDFTKYGLHLICSDCGSTKVIDLDIFLNLMGDVVIVKDLDKFIDEMESQNPLKNYPNVRQIPINRKPAVKQEKKADIIYLKKKD